MHRSARTDHRMVVLALYPWPEFWSMGEGAGAPSFFLSVTAFPRLGHEMHVLMPGGWGKPRTEDYHGVHLHRMRTSVDFMPDVERSKVLQHLRILSSYWSWFALAVPAGILLARRLKPDVIFGMGALGAPAAYAVARACRLPNVTRLFGMSLGQVAGSWIKTMLRYPERHALGTPASYIILHNDGSGGDEVAARYRVPRSKLLFWPNGIDKRAYGASIDTRGLRERLGVPEKARVVLAVARLHPEKRIERLLRAAPAVLSERRDVVFLLVGEGGERGRLERLADDLDVRENIVLAGSLPREEMPAVYRLADVFVTLSDRTNMGNPLDEAMLSGLPVVALNTGRTGDVVRNEETGVLLETDDLPRLAGVILGLLSDSGRAKRLGEAARADADRRLPTVEERQAMEVEAVARAVREHEGKSA